MPIAQQSTQTLMETFQWQQQFEQRVRKKVIRRYKSVYYSQIISGFFPPSRDEDEEKAGGSVLVSLANGVADGELGRANLILNFGEHGFHVPVTFSKLGVYREYRYQAVRCGH